jgi:hypothetical protein
MINKVDTQKNNFCRSCNNRKQEASCRLCNLPLCGRCIRFLYFKTTNESSMYRLNVVYNFLDKKPNEDIDTISSIGICQDCLDKTLDVYSQLDFQKEIYRNFKTIILNKLSLYIKNRTW